MTEWKLGSFDIFVFKDGNLVKRWHAPDHVVNASVRAFRCRVLQRGVGRPWVHQSVPWRCLQASSRIKINGAVLPVVNWSLES